MTYAGRVYQDEAIAATLAALREHQRVIVCMPTGTGKTICYSRLAELYLRAGHRVLVLAHREELLEQGAEKLEAITGILAAFEQAARAEATLDSQLVIASVPSLINRLDRFPPDHFKLVILDEAHHALATSFLSVLDHFTAKTVGFTATPNRGDEKALAQVFGAVAYDMTLADAIGQGWLVPPYVETIECPSLDLARVRSRSGELAAGDLGRVLSEIAVLREAIGPALRRAAGLKALVFCATRAHMACVAACIREMAEERQLELHVSSLDGTTPPKERAQIVDAFRRAGGGTWLLNIDVATEGFDVADVDALILLRPTIVRPRYMQQIGRGLRPLAGCVDGLDVDEQLAKLGADPRVRHLQPLRGRDDAALARRIAIATSRKPRCLILDFAGNAGRHELVSPLDLLGGDFEPVEVREAQRLVGAGLSPDLWAALEAARAARAAKMADRLARAGDPFALFGLAVPSKSRFGAAPSAKLLAVIGALRSPRRIQDAREADALVRELARREAAGLALYSQLALLARLGHPLEPLRAMPRRVAAGLVRDRAREAWARAARERG